MREISRSLFKGFRIRNMDQTLPLFGQNTNRTNYFEAWNRSISAEMNEGLPNSEFKLRYLPHLYESIIPLINNL